MTEEAKQPTQVQDPTVLRAIAHPLRNRILGEMYAAGHLRAADVARELGVPANQASFHLRLLAKYGLIEPAPEHARDGRDRVWKPVHEEGLTLRVNDFLEEPGGEAAVSVFRRRAAAEAKATVERAYAGDHDEGVEVMLMNDWVRLTKNEAAAYGEELRALQERWRQRTRDDQPGRRTYELMQILQPAAKPRV